MMKGTVHLIKSFAHADGDPQGARSDTDKANIREADTAHNNDSLDASSDW